MSRLILSLCLACVTALVAGCAGLRSGWTDPDIAIAALRMGPGEGFHQIVYVDLVITNFNRSQLALDGISYRVSLEGHPLVRGISREPLKVAPGASARYTVPAGLNLLSSAGLIHDLLLKPRNAISYRLDATLDPAGWWTGGDISIEKSDTISLTR